MLEMFSVLGAPRVPLVDFDGGFDAHSFGGRELAGGGFDESVDADLDGAIDFTTDLLLPLATAAFGELAAGPCAEALPVGHQGATCTEGKADAPTCEDPLHPPPGPGHRVDEKEPGVDDHVSVDALKKAPLSTSENPFLFGIELSLLLKLVCRGLDIVAIDARFHRRGDEICMRECLERLCLQRSSENLLDLVSRVVSHT